MNNLANSFANKLILVQAAAHLVTAYKRATEAYQQDGYLDLRIDRNGAPETFQGLRMDAANGVLRVTDKHSDTSIYGVAGNLAFRFFHDFGHIRYGAEFTTQSEVWLAARQWEDLVKYLPAEWRTVCCVVYTADTVKQSLYEAKTGQFPADQKAFVLRDLEAHLNGWAA